MASDTRKKNRSSKKDDNIVAEVTFMHDGNPYQCVGVVMHNTDKKIEIAFNAINDVVKDRLNIKKKDVVKIDFIDPSKIKHL